MTRKGPIIGTRVGETGTTGASFVRLATIMSDSVFAPLTVFLKDLGTFAVPRELGKFKRSNSFG